VKTTRTQNPYATVLVAASLALPALAQEGGTTDVGLGGKAHAS